jgi:hypothetical protein
MTAINRREALLVMAGSAAAACCPRIAAAAVAMGLPWPIVPTVIVIGPAGDSRLVLVHDAVAFWNQTFVGLGSTFRLGAVTEKVGILPARELAALSEATLAQSEPPALPADVMAAPGNIVVALSDGDFVSFCARRISEAKALVAIRSGDVLPMTLPNVARNVIAHEPGHSIGLGHNSDPAFLMCGRPALCRPTAFQSASEHYFPLTDDERALLLRLYPAGWQPR